MRRLTRCLVVGAIGAALCVLPAARTDAKTPEQTSDAYLKKRAKSHVKFMRSAEGLGGVLQRYCDALAGIEASAKSGAIDPLTAFGLINIAAELAMQQAFQVLSTVMHTIESDVEGELPKVSLPHAFRGALFGDCGVIDALQGTCEDAAQDFARDILTKTKKTGAALAKAYSTPMTHVFEPPVVIDAAPTAPGETPPADPPFKPLRMDAFGGSSDSRESNDGRLCVSGTADPRNGASVTIEIVGPDGVKRTSSANVNQGTCRWRVCFPPADSDAGVLPEGNYRINAQQGTGKVSRDIGVP